VFGSAANLVGIVHTSARASLIGILIILGGPQYRIGSHRQFVLLARAFAQAGFPVLRFDYRGVGDSDGQLLSECEPCLQIENDISDAVTTLFESAESITQVALLGLCDGATAAALYAHNDPRISHLILLNPWPGSEGVSDKTYLAHHYLRRLRWEKLLQLIRRVCRGQFRWRASVQDLIKHSLGAMRERSSAKREDSMTNPTASGGAVVLNQCCEALRKFSGKVLFVFGGRDYVAAEFQRATALSHGWREVMKRADRSTMADADHTFSQSNIRKELADQITTWIRSSTCMVQ